MSYFRTFERLLRDRLSDTAPLIQVVVGPRQVGKTTAIQQALNGRGLYETADSPAPLDPENIEQWWRQALSTPDRILAIDEIQKIPAWSETIKKLWDRSQRSSKSETLKVVLSGSAALAIEKDLKESLAGRFELIRAEHWNFAEAREVFGCDLKRFVEFGCYPGSMALIEDLPRWGAYLRDSIIEPAIGRDILQLHPVNSPALLRQVFGVATSLPAQVVSLNKLQAQLQDRGAIATIQHYLELLSHGFLVTGVQKFSAAPIRAKRSSPKIIVHDNALLRAMERPVSSALTPERFGRYFENAVGARLIEAGWEVFYWNDRNLDVDFVALGPEGQRLAIEVKSSPVGKEDLKGLWEFQKRQSDFEPCLISYKNQELKGVKTWPVESVLSLCRLC
jgi:uncharacterized protein